IEIDLRRGRSQGRRQQPEGTNRFETSHVALDIAHLIQSYFPEGQVAQSVERSPEKAGVGGSIPSLATTSITSDPAVSSLLGTRSTLPETSNTGPVANCVGVNTSCLMCLLR